MKIYIMKYWSERNRQKMNWKNKKDLNRNSKFFNRNYRNYGKISDI